MTGAVVSATVTLKLPFAVLPAASLAEQLTVVAAMGNVEPDAGVQDTGTLPSTASVAEAEYVIALPDGPEASSVILAGRLKSGPVESATTILKLLEALLLRESEAEQLTVLFPNGKVAPEAGEQFIVTEPSTRSVAEAV